MAQNECSDPRCFAAHHTPQERDAKIRQQIRKSGWAVLGVLGTPSIAYTIGLTERRWPELLFTLDVVGTTATLGKAQRLLNAVAHLLAQAGEEPRHGQVVTVPHQDGGQWRCLLETRLNTASLVMARNYYRRSVRAFEVELVE